MVLIAPLRCIGQPFVIYISTKLIFEFIEIENSLEVSVVGKAMTDDFVRRRCLIRLCFEQSQIDYFDELSLVEICH